MNRPRAFVSGAMGRVRSNLVELEAALLAYPRCMAPSDTLLVGSRPSAAGALVQAPHLAQGDVDPSDRRRGPPDDLETVCSIRVLIGVSR